MSSLAEIQQAIEKLAPKERSELRNWLEAQEIEENSEFLAAVDQGIRSAQNEPESSLEDAMKRLEERFGSKLINCSSGSRPRRDRQFYRRRQPFGRAAIRNTPPRKD
jgi:hypothetical protein